MAHILTSQIPRNLSRNQLFRSSSVSCFNCRSKVAPELLKETVPSKSTKSSTAIPRRSQSQPCRALNSFKWETARRFESASHQKKMSTTRLSREEEEEIEEHEEQQQQEHEEDHHLPQYEETEGAEFYDMKNYDTTELNMQAETVYKQAIRTMVKEEDKGYRLEITQPKKYIDEPEYDVFDHYSKLYEMKQTSLMPHLQPSNMKPYGSRDTLTFPAMKSKQSFIEYPFFTEGSDAPDEPVTPTSSQQREYSTLQKVESLPNVRYKKKPSYTAKLTKDSMGRSRSKHDYTVQNANPVTIIPNKPSKEIEKCNEIISEFKKLNPDEEITKRNLTPGSVEEREAVNRALQFASEYRKKFLSSDVSSSENTTNLTTETNLEVLPEEPAKIKTISTSKTAIEEIRALSERIFREHASEEVSEESSVVENEPIKLTQVPRSNVPQTSALPEERTLFDNIQKGDKEKLIAPWPSYSDNLKLLRNASLPIIKYPSMNNNTFNVYTESKIPVLQKRGYCGIKNNNMKLREKVINRNALKNSYKTSPMFNQSIRSFCAPSSRHPLGREGTVMPKLKRLPKVKVPNPPDFKCPIKKNIVCSKRADEGLKVKRKELPVLEAPYCPKVKERSMKEGEPLPFPKKRRVTQETCKPKPPEKICQPRADAGLKVVPKKLPKIKPKGCPGVQSKMKDSPPLKRLVPMEVPKPKRVCKPQVKSYCAPRADEDLEIERKELPVLEPPPCPRVKGRKMKDVKLPRLEKVEVPEPKRVCPPPAEACQPRADKVAKYKLKPKKLIPLVLSKKYNDVGIYEYSSGKRRAKKSKKGKKGKRKTKKGRGSSGKRKFHTSCRDSKEFTVKAFRSYFEDANARVVPPSKAEVCAYWLTTNIFQNNLMRNPNLFRMRSRNLVSGTCMLYSTKGKDVDPCCSPCPKVEKTLWQKICDYFRARPNCPTPEDYKKKQLREKAEKAAAKAGLYICEKPPEKKKLPCVVTDKDVDLNPSSFPCQLFKVKNCPPRVRQDCEPPEPKRVDCKPKEAPYPSFSDCQPKLPPSDKSECAASEKKWKKIKESYMDNLNKGYRRRNRRGFSTSTLLGRSLEQRRHYSSNRNEYDPFAFFEHVAKENLKKLDQKELAKRILEAVRRGMEAFEKSNTNNSIEDSYCRIYKELEHLSRQEICRNRTRNLLNERLKFQIIDSRRNLCRDYYDYGNFGGWQTKEDKTSSNLLAENSYHDGTTPDVLRYEESEKRKTDEMVRQLEELLKTKQP